MVMGTSSILIPLMLAEVLGRSVRDLGILSSLVSLVGVVGSLVWGRLSDAAHRRKLFVVLSFAALSIGFAGLAFVHSFGTLLVVNMALNFFWVANAAVTVLIVIENQDHAAWESKIGHLNQIGAFGWVGGLLLGSAGLAVLNHFVLETTALRLLSLILAVGASGATVLALVFVPRTRPRFTRRRFRGAVVALGNFLVEQARFGPFHLYHRFAPRNLPTMLWGPEGLRHETKLFLLATLLVFTGLGFFAVPLPLLLYEHFNLPSSMVFLYFMVQHVAVVGAYPLASRRIMRWGNKNVQIAALLVRMVLFTATSVFLSASSTAPSAPMLVVFFLLIGGSWSYFQLSGVALVSRLAKPENRGKALGLYNAIAGVGAILAGVAAGFIVEGMGYQATFAVAAVLLVIALGILYRMPLPRLRRAPTTAFNRSEQANSTPRNGTPTDASRNRAGAQKEWFAPMPRQERP